MDTFRKTTQHLLPPHKSETKGYDLYPAFSLTNNSLLKGYASLTKTLSLHPIIILDGFVGVMWDNFRTHLNTAFEKLELTTHWTPIDTALKNKIEIEVLTNPFMGHDDPIFGKRFTGNLVDFFDKQKLESLQPNPNTTINILYGTGAALAHWKGFLVYLDLPKNELQFRARANLPSNLGLSTALPPKTAYKRSYFIDWPALNQHKATLLPNLDLVVDSQNPDCPTFIDGSTLREGLKQMSKNYFRARPWFEPGAGVGNGLKNTSLNWLKMFLIMLGALN